MVSPDIIVKRLSKVTGRYGDSLSVMSSKCAQATTSKAKGRDVTVLPVSRSVSLSTFKTIQGERSNIPGTARHTIGQILEPLAVVITSC